MRRTAGNVIVIAFDRSDAANKPREAPSHRRWRRPTPSTARRYARSARSPKSPDTTSRRSVTHATDSTRSGWSPKTSAASSACRRTLVR
ncbi:MAG: hypothetical protein DME17_09560 [Candidatus Rokuibacteriota bacterium]|nr:MAG: hypothetical protein DME17_09560 [Candidatus Rokubacteria bacterium]